VQAVLWVDRPEYGAFVDGDADRFRLISSKRRHLEGANGRPSVASRQMTFEQLFGPEGTLIFLIKTPGW
jgi:hypothetical protein